MTTYLCTLFFAVFVGLQVGSIAFAQENKTGEVLTLKNTIKRTLASNPALQEFEFRQKAIDGQTKTASLRPEFELGLEVENAFGTGEVSGIKETEITLTLSSIIELGDKKKFRKGLVSAQSSLVDVEQKVRTLDLLGELTRRYIDVLAQQELLSVVEEAESLARYTMQAVNERVEVGASPLIEKKRAEAALAKARLNNLTAQRNLGAMHHALAILWGEKNPKIAKVEGNLFELGATPAFSELFQQAETSPNIEIYAAESRIQDAQLRLNRSQSKADIGWSAGVRRFNGIDETAFVAGVSMPLFSSNRNLGEYESQRAIRELINTQKQVALQSLYNQLYQSLQARIVAVTTVKTIQTEILPPLEEALDLVNQAYSDGRYSYLEWVSTSQELLEAKRMLIEAAKQAHQRAADIESLTSVPLVSIFTPK